MKIPNLEPPIHSLYPIIAEAMQGERVRLTDADLQAPLTHLETKCYVESGAENKGVFVIGSLIGHPDTPYTHTFIDDFDLLLRGQAEEAGTSLHTSFIEAADVRLGLRINTHTRGMFSTVRLACLSDGWDVMTHLGYKEELKHPKVLGSMLQHYYLLNVLTRALVEFDGDQSQEAHYYSVLSMKAGLEAPKATPRSIPEIREDARRHFDDFAGIDYIIEEILDMVALGTEGVIDSRDAVARIPALMLYGDSGVGKTEIARALTKALNAREEYVGFEKIQSMYVGEWATKIARTFDRAFESGERTVIIFDEFDGLTNSGNTGTSSNINAVLKQKLEQLKDYPEVFVVLTSNSLDKIDPAVIADKRIPLKLHIRLPSEEELRAVFAKVLEVDLDSDASRLKNLDIDGVDLFEALSAAKYDLSVLAREAAGFSPGDVHELVQRAKRQLIIRHGKAAENINQEVVIAAIKFARKHRPQAL